MLSLRRDGGAAGVLRRLGAVLVLSGAALWAQSPPSTINLTATTSPATGQPGVTVLTLIGSNFPAGTIPASQVSVTLQLAPNTAGPSLSTTVTAFAPLPLNGGRITFQVTGTNVATPTPYLVSVSGSTSTGATFVSGKPAALTINPAAKILSVTPSSGAPGLSVPVTITAQYTNYVQGSTTANFGPDILVDQLIVKSATTAIAVLTIAGGAEPGPRPVTVATGVQQASLLNGFTVTQAMNQPPVVSAGANQTVILPDSAALNGSLSDDGLPFGATLTANWSLLSAPVSTGAQFWLKLAPTGTLPSPRNEDSVVFDPVTDRLILFGGGSGVSAISPLNDVWVLTNANGLNVNPSWMQLQPTGTPPTPRFGHAAFYDPNSNRMVIFGGGGVGGYLNDVWILTNANGLGGAPAWVSVSPLGTPPSPRRYVGLAYDPGTNRMIIFGCNFGGPVGTDLNDVWVLTNANGTETTAPTWIQLAPDGTLPAARTNPMVAYDAGSNRLITFGGGVTSPSNSIAQDFNDTWVLTNANGIGGTPTWIQLTPDGSATSPSQRFEGEAVYNPSTNAFTIVGGIGNCNPLLEEQCTAFSDVWSLSHANGIGGSPTWTPLSPIGGPPAPVGFASYDAVNDRLISFGGGGGYRLPVVFYNDTWVLTNATNSDPGGIPGKVSVSNPTFSTPDVAGQVFPVSTNATFSIPGSYVLRLTANDSQLTGTSDVTVAVQPPTGLATAAAAVPNAGQAGQQSLSVTITALNTHFAQGTTQVSFGSGITVSSVSVTDAMHLTAVLNIAASATLGFRDVTVTTGAEIVSLSNGFTVQGTATILSVNPNAGQQGQQNLLVTITGQFTHFFQGPSSVNLGAGITVGAVTVASSTSLTAQINIALNATLGLRTVTVTTETEVATLSGGFTVTQAVNQPPIVSAGPNQTISLPPAPVTITEYQIPTPSINSASSITTGPDGNLWFPEHDAQKIGRITATGAITEFPVPTSSGALQDIAAGPDGNLWFTDYFGQTIWRMTTTGVATAFASGGFPNGITAGPDGNLWFTERFGNAIGRITPVGLITGFPLPTGGSQPEEITAGPDGNLWFTETSANQIGRITPAGVIAEFPIPTSNSGPQGINPGPDGNLWFAETTANQIGRITPAGTVTEFPIPTSNSQPYGITAGPDGNVWFAEQLALQPSVGQIGRITPTGVVTEFAVPTFASRPFAITLGPDCNLWFTEIVANKIVKMVPGVLPVTTTMTGSITDDGLPFGATLTATWTATGAAFVSFTNPIATFPDVAGQTNPVGTSGTFCRVGPYTLNLTGSDSQLSRSSSVTITVNLPQIPVLSVSPNTGLQGQQSLAVHVTGQNTHFVQGATIASFGGGIVVASLTVNSPTSATAVLDIDSASVGSRDVSLTTGNEIATLPSGFSVTSSASPAITLISPNSGQQGQQNLLVTITGQNTHFAQGTSGISFGPDIAVNIVTVSGATSLTANITIPTTATLGAQTVTVTTGSEIASVIGGFTVMPIAAVLISVSPDTLLYIGNLGSNDVSAYSISFGSGALTPVAGSPFAAGPSPSGVVITPSGRYAFTGNYTQSGGVSAFSIDPSTGALTRIAGSPFPSGSNPYSLTVSPSGQFLYAANYGSDSVSAYSIDSSTGALTPVPGSPFPVGTNPYMVGITPSGQFAYVPNSNSDSISAFQIDATTGALTAVPGSPFSDTGQSKDSTGGGAYPAFVAASPSGQFLYVANGHSWDIAVYSIRPANGVLTPLSGSPFPAAPEPIHITFAPSGEFAYVTNSGTPVSRPDGSVSVFTVNTASGALTQVPGSPFASGAATFSGALDASGHYFYAANDYANTVSAFETSSTTGTLSPIFGSPFATGQAPNSMATGPNRPAVGYQGQQNLKLNLTGQYTHWVQGTTNALFGAGITVASLTVNSLTSATAVVNVDPGASVGSRDVSVTTGNEIVTLPSGFSVISSAPAPAITQISPNSGQQGQQNLSVNITGQFTHFFQGTTGVGLGAGITAGSLTVASATSLTVPITIALNAALGPRNVTVTTGTELLTLSSGFTVTQAVNQPPVVSAGPNQTIALPPAPVTFTEFQIPTPENGGPGSITIGPDGNLWFPEPGANKIGRLTPTGAFTEFPVPTSSIQDIAAGPDGNLWFADYFGQTIWRMTPTGVTTGFASGGYPTGITAGPDGNLWFIERFGNAVGRITPTGMITTFPIPTGGSSPFEITTGPDGNLWFTEGVGNQIGRITPAGVITEFEIPTGSSFPYGITAGPDGNLWFTETFGANNVVHKIGRITTSGVITEFSLSTSGGCPGGPAGCAPEPIQITAGPDGNLWFTERYGNKIARITTSGVITEFPVPTASSEPYAIIIGPDCNLWFTENVGNKIGKVIPGVLPVTTTLNGSILDDGLPFGAMLTATWSATGGRAPVLFGTPTATFPDVPGQTNPVVTSATFCRVGPYTLNLTGSDSLLTSSSSATITVNPPQIPVLSVNPNTGQQGQQNLSVSIAGQLTHFAQGTTVASFGAGITVASLTVNSPTSATAVLTIDSAAPVGSSDVSLTTGNEIATLPSGFSITSSGAFILSLDPGGTYQAQTVSVAIVGQNTHFLQGTSTATFGPGIAVGAGPSGGFGPITVTSPTTATAQIVVDLAAVPGLRTVTVQTGTEQASFVNGFTILPLPSLISIMPNSGQPGQANLAVAIAGSATHFAQGITQVSFGAGITTGAITVTDSTHLSVPITIAANAAPGPRDVFVTSGQEVVPLGNGFIVSGTAALTKVSPNFGQTGTGGPLTITGQNTHFVQGTTQLNMGAGITVNSVTVNSSTSLTAQVVIAGTATAGPRTVAVTTGAEVVSLVNAFNVMVNQPPVITIPSTWNDALPNRVTLTYAVTDDGLPLGGALTVAWQTISGPGNVGFQNQTLICSTCPPPVPPGPINTTGSVSVGFDQPGTYVLQISATDTQLTTTQNVTVTVTGTLPPPPTVSITSPTEGSQITTLTNVTGSVASTALASWTLQMRMQTESIYRPIATGTTPVTNGLLGTFDPTLLLNGIALIELVATDTTGQTSTFGPVSVVVTGNQKVGNFTVSFNDLTVPLEGLPIQIVRTYDSRNKLIGDFGVGWRLDINAVTLQTNGPLGANWNGTTSGGFLPNYCIQPAQAHVVTVTLSDGTLYQFQPTLSPNNGCQQVVPLDQVTVGFAPISPTPPNASLAIVGNNQPFVNGNFPGTVTLLDLDDVTVLDPDFYQLTLPDGRVLVISKQSGLQSLTDLNGNKLTVTPAGITHSSGKGVAFARDSLNRITQVTDPSGNKIQYTYDIGTGDLISVQDQVGNVTTFTYDGNHGLLTIKDPRGVQPIKNVYDNNGRLIQHIDAFGKVINYTNNLNAQQEIVTDRLGNVTANYYDANGNIIKVTDALGGNTLRTYNANNNLLTETNPLNETRTYTYDANNNRLSEADPLGNTTTYAYNGRNQVLTVTDPLGRVTTNVYDANGNLLSTKDPSGNTTSYMYNAAGLQTSATDPLGGVTGSQYDGSGNLTQRTDALGNVTTYTYDADGNRLSQTQTRTGSNGQETLVTSYQYDGLNRVTKAIYPDGSTTQVQYNTIGKQSGTIDQLNRQTSYQYDLMGRLTQTTYPDTATESSTYDAEGDRISSTDRGGRTTGYVYDALKRLTQTVYADNTTTTRTYDAAGEVTAAKDPRGDSTQYQYDTAGRRTQVIDALSHTTAFAYDKTGNQLSMTDPNGNTTQYQYDNNNRRTAVIYPDTTTDSAAYDGLGRTTSKTDQAGQTTQYGYDKLGRLVHVTDALSQLTKYTYDEIGDRITQTDANNHTTSFAYDKLGRRIKRTLPLGMSETFAYDAAGNPISHTDFNGKTTAFAYDTSNRLTTKTPDLSFSAPNVTFTYTASGQRQSMADASGTTTYSYDLRDRLLTKGTPQGTLSYAYDAAGNLLSIQSSNAGGTSVAYAYDSLNRLATVKDNRLVAGTTNYSYDNVGNLAGYQYPNGVKSAYTYNTLNRLTNLAISSGANTMASYAYTLGPSGNRIAVGELGGRQVGYTYDRLYRLTGETISGAAVSGTIGYTYDAVGNRLTRISTVVPVPAATSTYDANDRLTSDTYDANGNTTASGANTYSYDFENRLTTENTNAVTIVYDGDGNRVAKTAGGVTTKYLVDDRNLTGYAQVLEEISGGTVLRVYTYGLNRISQSQASGTSFYGYDGHGSVRLLTDATGAVTDRYDYDAFGNILSQSGSTANVYLYSGEQNDPNLGLYYLRARYLSQSSGRFWTMDTVEGDQDSPVSLHKYTYVGNEPVVRVDPSGNQFDLVSLSLEVADLEVLSSETTVHAGGLFTATQTQGHGIFLDGHCFPCGGLPWKHAFLKLVPTDLNKWLTTRSHGDAFATGSATIGAGGVFGVTANLLTLAKGINRPTDVNDPISYGEKLQISPNQEDAAITRLFTLFDRYKNDLPYDKWPFSQRPGYYNSNSFISGLLDAAGIMKPSSFPVGTFPDWANPVPPWEF